MTLVLLSVAVGAVLWVGAAWFTFHSSMEDMEDDD